MRFAERRKLFGSTVFAPIWQSVPRADHLEGESLLSEPSRPSGQWLQLSECVCSFTATARLAPPVQFFIAHHSQCHPA
jgi:hypothetical protein